MPGKGHPTPFEGPTEYREGVAKASQNKTKVGKEGRSEALVGVAISKHPETPRS